VQKEEETIINELADIPEETVNAMTPMDKKKKIETLTKLMRKASKDLDFETAARYRDIIAGLTKS